MAKSQDNKIFTYGRVENTSYMNWRTSRYDDIYNYTVLGDGFSQAALILMDKILEDNTDKKGDVLIFPIFYNINQAIEVYLKAIIYVLNELKGDIKENIKDHDIRSLLSQMKARIEKVEDSTKGLEKYLKPLSSYINELYGKIYYDEKGVKSKAHIDFARYPVTTAGTQHFYIKNHENEVVNIKNLREKFKEAKECLKNLYFMYSNRLESIKEMKAEAEESRLCY